MKGSPSNHPWTKAAALGVALALVAGSPGQTTGPATAPRSNLEYWLSQPTTATASQPGSAPAGVNPFTAEPAARQAALPGVVLLSDGTTLAGSLLTTGGRNWQVWVESEKRWRDIPPVAVLSITAEVVEEALELEWRWKEMGADEKVLTGRKKPFRRFLWRFHLIDDSLVTGAVKGQPLWIETPDGKRRLLVLHERSEGQFGQSLQDLVYPQKVIISRRAMEEALKGH